MLIKTILQNDVPTVKTKIAVSGWVRTKRDMKNLVFIELNDGSCLSNLQCTFDKAELKGDAEKTLNQIITGYSVCIRGVLITSPAKGQKVELAASEIEVLGEAPADYPLQKKGHSPEFLREIVHLRARTNLIGSVMRVRSHLAFAAHEFFKARDFFYVNTPVITANDAEGAGEMFQVTTLDIDTLTKSGKAPDYKKDFFAKKTFLTVSGQLEGETYAAALGRIYTFGPTFRAENSNTVRHLAEFWMIEPEAAFFTLDDNMKLAEDFLKELFTSALKNCSEELNFFDMRIQKGLIQNLTSIVETPFARITYTDAVKELEKNKNNFEFKVEWGSDLQSEHERFLTEKVFNSPVIVTDYPKQIKAFYMKANEDGKTVRAMDVLVPRLGEIIGGSQREEDYNKLYSRMKELGMNTDDYSWYLDLRRYGTVVHSGFGLGFERLVQYVTGVANIRDVIPYPRAASYAA